MIFFDSHHILFRIKRRWLISAGERNFRSCVEIPSQSDGDLERSEFKILIMSRHQPVEYWKKIKSGYWCIFVRNVAMTLTVLYYDLGLYLGDITKKKCIRKVCFWYSFLECIFFFMLMWLFFYLGIICDILFRMLHISDRFWLNSLS